MSNTLRLCLNLSMLLIFLSLYGYHITGNLVHEILGTILLILLIVHHVLNAFWYSHLHKGRLNPLRILYIIVNIPLALAMSFTFVSGLMLSNVIFRYFEFPMPSEAISVHMCASAWSLILMSAHLGLNLGSMTYALGRGRLYHFLTVMMFLCGFYGIYAFLNTDLIERLLLLTGFPYFDFSKSPVFFYFDYLCIIATFTSLSSYILLRMHKRSLKNKKY